MIITHLSCQGDRRVSLDRPNVVNLQWISQISLFLFLNAAWCPAVLCLLAGGDILSMGVELPRWTQSNHAACLMTMRVRSCRVFLRWLQTSLWARPPHEEMEVMAHQTDGGRHIVSLSLSCINPIHPNPTRRLSPDRR